MSGWFIGGAAAVVTAALLAGCETTAAKTEAVASGAGQVMSAVDPTGTVRRNVEIGAASAALEERLKELDLEAFNSTVARLGALADTLRERVDSLMPEVSDIVRRELDIAQLAKLSQRLQALAARSSRQVGDVDVEAFNKLIAETRAKVTDLDINEANNVIRELGGLKPRLDEVLARASAALERIEQAAEALPLAETETVVQSIHESVAGMQRSAWGLTVTVWLANALLLMLCVCTVVWLRKAGRR